MPTIHFLVIKQLAWGLNISLLLVTFVPVFHILSKNSFIGFLDCQ